MKRFNINGLCYPDKHYMVDIQSRLEEIKNLVGNGNYFMISGPHQYGKTTTLYQLKKYLQPDYAVVSMSFQRMSSAKFRDEYTFSQAFADAFLKKIRELRSVDFSEKSIEALESAKNELEEKLDLVELFNYLSEICKQAEKKVVLMIDEVDQASNNQIFLDFLGQLRDLYLDREQNPTFYSVILAGVYDVKNLRRKIRPEEEHRYNSPWNIAVTFSVDLSFSAKDIATMLNDYESEQSLGINVDLISEELYRYTGGYPFLVSCLCKKIDEEEYSWSASGVRLAVRDLLKEKNVLFDDVIKNIQNNQDFSNLIEQILLCGAQVIYEINNPLIDLGVVFGIFAERDGKVVVSNVIFETLILNYFTSVRSTLKLTASDYTDKSLYIQDGKLNMELVIKRFASFLKSEYRNEDGAFIERQGRLLFLSFLRPIINGTGHYAVEPQTRQNNRMDILVFYGNEEFVIELKIWRGEKYEQKAYDQLVEYLDARDKEKGYLICFCSNTKKTKKDEVFLHKGHQICEVVIDYCAKEDGM